MNYTFKKEIIEIIKEAKISPDKTEQLTKKINEVLDQYKEPISSILWIPISKIKSNNYNPNKMATPEKKILTRSLLYHGITSPLVVLPEKDKQYLLLDGYHRFKIIKREKILKERLKNKIPVVVLNISNEEGIVATIRHNRARGKHQIQQMSEVVKTLTENGWSTKKIMNELGMENDEVLRLKQFSGLGNLFKDEDFSLSWK